MILESSFDQLMQNVWSYQLMNVGSREVIREGLR